MKDTALQPSADVDDDGFGSLFTKSPGMLQGALVLGSDDHALAPNEEAFVMIKRFLRSSAIYPNDLAMLQRVFDKCCTDGGLTQLSAAAEFEAATLLNLFQTASR